MPVPQNAKQVKQFLGLVGYYRKFVPHFSDIARPLTQLTRKNEGFNWSTECDKCFHMLKDYLQESLILRYPDPTADYILYTDASKYAYAGVLTQSINGTDHPVAYTSRLFRGSQLNWAALTKEAYAIYMSVKKLSFYLDSAQITLRSDHLPLKKFLGKNTMNTKVNNWAVELESQNINFEFIAGTKNVLEETLSRLIEYNESRRLPEEEPGYEFGYTPFKELPPARVTVIEEVIISENQGDQLPESLKKQHNDPIAKDIKIELPLTNSKIKELQEKDPLVGRLRKQWSEKKLDKKHFTMENEILKKKTVINGILYTPTVVPDVLKECLLILAQTSRVTMGSKGPTVHSNRCTIGKARKRLFKDTVMHVAHVQSTT